MKLIYQNEPTDDKFFVTIPPATIPQAKRLLFEKIKTLNMAK